MKRILRIGLVLVILAGLLVSVANPASANSKQTFYFEFPLDFTYACPGGQTLVGNENLAVDITSFFTKDGDYFMGEDQFTMSGSLYLQEKPNNVLYYDKDHWKNMYKPGEHVQSAGIIGKINVPGYGILFKDIGLIKYVWDTNINYWVPVFSAGEHQDVIDGDYSTVCSYLTTLP
jgi:hypothetical protein